jgi:hypothetical protein
MSVFVSEDGFSLYRERHHERDVANLPNPGAGDGKAVYVGLLLVDDLDEGRREPVVINVEGAECMTPDLAMRVAAHLVAAVALARGEATAVDDVQAVAALLQINDRLRHCQENHTLQGGEQR